MWKQTQHLSSDYFLGLSRFLNINCKFVPIFPYRWQCKAWLRPQCCRWNGNVSLTGESEVLAIHQYIQHVWSSGHGQGASDWNGDRGKTGWLSTFERQLAMYPLLNRIAFKPWHNLWAWLYERYLALHFQSFSQQHLHCSCLVSCGPDFTISNSQQRQLCTIQHVQIYACTTNNAVSFTKAS